LVKLQGDFHFSFDTSTKRSEQPQGDFFARIALQREPCFKHDCFYFIIYTHFIEVLTSPLKIQILKIIIISTPDSVVSVIMSILIVLL
jgi:hypothetical protein